MSVIAQSDGALKIICPGALDSTYSAAAYHRVKGKGLYITANIWNTSAILLRVAIPSGSSGTLLGFETSTYAMKVTIASDTLTYTNGSHTATHAVDTSGAVHLIGFLDGQAYYDGKLTSWSVTGAMQNPYLGIGHKLDGTAIMSDALTNSGSYAMELHRVLVMASAVSSGIYVAKAYSYMPTTSGHMYQLQPYASTRTLSWISSSGGSVTVGSAITYGVSIEDVKAATGTMYRDLICQLGEDDGSPDTGADACDGLLSGSTSKLQSAFALSDIDDDGTRSSQMSVPAGITFKSYGSSTYGYTKGDLIMGRHPKWKLWADGVNMGKSFGDDHPGGDWYGRFRYNIFMNATSCPTLEQWEGYCASEVHEPFFKLTDSSGTELERDASGRYARTIETHNGYGCVTGTANRYFWGSGSGIDAKVMYSYIPSVIYAMFALGNIVEWDKTESEQPADYKIGGMLLELRGQGVSGAQMAYCLLTAGAWLSKDSSAAVKTLYRSGTTVQTLAFTSAFSGLATGTELDVLMSPYVNYVDTEPDDEDRICLDYVFPRKKIVISKTAVSGVRCLYNGETLYSCPKYDSSYVLVPTGGDSYTSYYNNGDVYIAFWLATSSGIIEDGPDNLYFYFDVWQGSNHHRLSVTAEKAVSSTTYPSSSSAKSALQNTTPPNEWTLPTGTSSVVKTEEGYIARAAWDGTFTIDASSNPFTLIVTPQ